VAKLFRNEGITLAPKVEAADDFCRLRHLNADQEVAKDFMGGIQNTATPNETSSTTRQSKWLQLLRWWLVIRRIDRGCAS